MLIPGVAREWNRVRSEGCKGMLSLCDMSCSSMSSAVSGAHLPISVNRSSGSQSKKRPGSSRCAAAGLAGSLLPIWGDGALLVAWVECESEECDDGGALEGARCARTADGDHFRGAEGLCCADAAWSFIVRHVNSRPRYGTPCAPSHGHVHSQRRPPRAASPKGARRTCEPRARRTACSPRDHVLHSATRCAARHDGRGVVAHPVPRREARADRGDQRAATERAGARVCAGVAGERAVGAGGRLTQADPLLHADRRSFAAAARAARQRARGPGVLRGDVKGTFYKLAHELANVVGRVLS